MKTIRLFTLNGLWMAEYTGDDMQRIVDLFGSNILPTAFTVKTTAEAVLKTIQELNPDATVLVAASAREAEHTLSIRQWNGQMKIAPVEVGTEYRVVWEIDVVAASAREAAEAARTIQKNPGSHATVFQVSDGKETVRVDLLEPLDDLPDSFEDEAPLNLSKPLLYNEEHY